MFSDNFDNWDDYINYRRADATVSTQPPTVKITMKFLQASCFQSAESLDTILPVVKSNPFWRLYFQANSVDFPYLDDTSALVNRKCLDDALARAKRSLADRSGTARSIRIETLRLDRNLLSPPKNKNSVFLYKTFVDPLAHTNINDFWSFLNCNVLDSIQNTPSRYPQVPTFQHAKTEELVLKIMERLYGVKDSLQGGPLDTFLVNCLVPFIQRVLEFDFISGNEDAWESEFASRWNPEITFFISFFDSIQACNS